MAYCEFCGKNVDKTVKVNVAGSVVNVCLNCASLGNIVEDKNITKPVGSVNLNINNRIKKNKQVVEYVLVPSYVSIMNSALAKRGINLHQLANVLNIRESTLNKYFSGKISIDIDTAKKIERYLSIKLVEEKESTKSEYVEENVFDSEDESFSLADVIKVVKKK